MKTKKPRKRYETANQIRDDIQRFKDKAQKLMDRAAACDLVADEFVKYGCRSPEDISFNREMAKKHRRAAARIQEKRLPLLKQKLAEFATETLPGVLPDRSVER